MILQILDLLTRNCANWFLVFRTVVSATLYYYDLLLHADESIKAWKVLVTLTVAGGGGQNRSSAQTVTALHDARHPIYQKAWFGLSLGLGVGLGYGQLPQPPPSDCLVTAFVALCANKRRLSNDMNIEQMHRSEVSGSSVFRSAGSLRLHQ